MIAQSPVGPLGERLPESLQWVAGHPGALWVAVLVVLLLPLLTRYRGYADRVTDRILDDPLQSLLYGVAAGAVTALVVGLLTLTIVGIMVATPIVATALVLSALGYLAAGRALGAGWRVAAVGALALAAAVGTLVAVDVRAGAGAGLFVGCLGVGGAVLDHVERTVRDGTPDDEGIADDNASDDGTAGPGGGGSSSATPADASAGDGPSREER